ncbi:uncharacterized protein LOC144104341 isoform X2 [Amblyomma americanum]
MGSIVKYRDLPGGPTEVRLADELSRYCLCTQCGMLSMSVYQDHHGHVFCDDCIQERSYRHHRYDIFCKHEQRNVSLDEMFEANDVVTLIRDQFTMCPNKKCGKCVALQALSDHYSQCVPAVQCPACHQEVRSQKWKEHWKKHSYAHYERNSTMGAREDMVNARENKLCTECSPKNHPAEGQRTSNLVVCDHCKRNVKETNLRRHLEVCPKAPKECVYCDENVLKENMLMFATMTEQSCSGCVSRTFDQAAEGSRHGAETVTKEDTWFGFFRSGDWLSAVVAMEESLKLDSTEERKFYASLRSRLFELNVEDAIRDFLDTPCPVQPLYCLLTVLLIRVYLPRSVWARSQEVTWKCALQYLPSFMAGRLSERALEYVCKYPVFLDRSGSRASDEMEVDGERIELGRSLEAPTLPGVEKAETGSLYDSPRRCSGEEAPHTMRTRQQERGAVTSDRKLIPLQTTESSCQQASVTECIPAPKTSQHGSLSWREESESLRVASETNIRASRMCSGGNNSANSKSTELSVCAQNHSSVAGTEDKSGLFSWCRFLKGRNKPKLDILSNASRITASRTGATCAQTNSTRIANDSGNHAYKGTAAITAGGAHSRIRNFQTVGSAGSDENDVVTAQFVSGCEGSSARQERLDFATHDHSPVSPTRTSISVHPYRDALLASPSQKATGSQQKHVRKLRSESEGTHSKQPEGHTLRAGSLGEDCCSPHGTSSFPSLLEAEKRAPNDASRRLMLESIDRTSVKERIKGLGRGRGNNF